MPDLSLLIPLSETLDISLNELLNGKYITEDKCETKINQNV